MQRRGFTLIELLVVIAIIGILATLVVTQLGTARVKARNTAAINDVSAMKTAVEVYKTANEEGVLATANSATATTGESINGAPSTAPLFSTALFSGDAAEYSTKITKTPSTDYTYRYFTNATSGARAYKIYATLVAVNGSDAYIQVENGETTGAATAPATIALPTAPSF